MTAQKIKVTQTGSPIGRPKYQRGTLVCLGLNRIGRSRVIDDTPENRGRLAKVHHLVAVEPASAEQ